MIFFQPPEALFRLRGLRATGVQLFRDYVRAFDIVDPWVLTEYLAPGAAGAARYAALTQGAECDSSVVVLDKRRAWRYLHGTHARATATRVPTCVPAYCPPVFLLTCLPAYLFTCLPAHLPTCPPAHLPTCPPPLYSGGRAQLVEGTM